MKPFPVLIACAVLVLPLPAEELPRAEPYRSKIDPTFQPILVKADFTSRQVRPGDPFGVTFTFQNRGTTAAIHNYMVFLHFEYPDATCDNIAIHSDHAPTLPTGLWKPGRKWVDGPHAFAVPPDAAEGIYHVHVGIYAAGRGGERLLDTYTGTLEVTRKAPALIDISPDPLAPQEISARRQRLAQRLKKPLALDRPTWRFSIDPANGVYELLDKLTNVRWTSSPVNNRFGRLELVHEKKTREVFLERFASASATSKDIQLATPIKVGGQPTGLNLQVVVEPAPPPGGLRIRYAVSRTAASTWQVRAVRLLDDAFGVTESDNGYAVVPFRMGEIWEPQAGLPSVRRFLTYSGATMALFGAVKQGSALLIAWNHPDTSLEIRRTWPNHPDIPGHRRISMSLSLEGQAHEFEIHPLGLGDYVKIAKAYRVVARRNGWLKTWAEKRKSFPQVDQMFGAADFKPFVFSRVVPSSRFNRSNKDHTWMSYTFDEAAQVAEHLHRNLKIDRAMYVLAGWIHRGYDNQHPDILPAAPECGGNAALVDCAQRVRDSGFLFGLHDNYQDMYEDAPSWNQKYLNKNKAGKSKKGGNWAGGQAWQVCAIKQVELARRPQNLPEVKRLFGPTCYFIDTVFAWGLVTCEDPNHPMTRSDDLKWKSRLCDTAKEYCGLFGSEEGREWAVPHADYFEGLFSHKTSAGRNGRGYSRALGGAVVPLFELVYGDCINLYTHQGDRATPSRPGYILDCIACAENPLYAFGPHLYFKNPGASLTPVAVKATDFKSLGPRKFQISYQWKASGPVQQDYHCFVHFTHPLGDKLREQIAFQDDHALPRPTSSWRTGNTIIDGPRQVQVPDKYSGDIQLWVGLTGKTGRVEFKGLASRGGRYLLGVLRAEKGTLKFKPSQPLPDLRTFARADQGWCEGTGLGETDRFIKNTYEVLSWLNRLTAEIPMTGHQFLTPDRSIEHSEFGDIQIWVNYGKKPCVVVTPLKLRPLTVVPTTTLPENGFLILSPRYVAFHATEFGGTKYEPSALFTARSLDRQPLWKTKKARLFHAFGSPTMRLAGRTFEVRKEKTVAR